MTKPICILDYGSGNVRSVYNMMSLLSQDVVISNKPSDLQAASHLILPGVGAFGSSMEKIKEKIPLDLLEELVVTKKKPFLGICVGMQVLANKGYEFGEHEGLGWIPGETKHLEVNDLPLPHVGWNTVSVKKETPLLPETKEDIHFYFVHSYAFSPTDKKTITGITEYGESFCSMVQKDNIMGVQFHPEKSQQAGQILLKNFISL